MLSNCRDCKYFNPELCAVNPSYRGMEAKLRSRLSDAELEGFEFGLLHCNDWEPSEELESLTLEVALTWKEWKQLLSRAASIPQPLAAQIQAAIGDTGEITMIQVDSSNVASIGYTAVDQVLQVDFLNGSRYRYLEVPQWVFEEFLEAHSKGRYLNNEIKGQFDCERVY